MSKSNRIPQAVGQLVWCPSDASLGVGIITNREGHHVRVRFHALADERSYTTRSELAILRYEIALGERVRHKDGHEVRIRRVCEPSDEGLAVYETEDGDTVVECDLLPNVRDVGAKERLASLNLAHPEVVRARLAGLQLAQFGARAGQAAILGARVQWLPHQVDVATRAIAQRRVRLLLADEVGLGKTVEAALIYAGLRHENRAKRVLIITPDALCIQWLGEIFRKAHELLVLMDDDRIEDATRDFPDMSPFDAYQRMVVSIDRLTTDEWLCEQAVATEYDLVIVDEAHHLRWRPEDGGNQAYRLLQQLAQRTQHLLLLTATPMALDPTEYHALLRLLDETRFDDPQTFEKIANRAATIRDLARDIGHVVQAGAVLPDPLVRLAQEVLGDDPHDQDLLAQLVDCDAKAAKRHGMATQVLDALRERHGLTEYVVRNRRGPVGGLPNRMPETFPLTASPEQEVLLEVGESVMFDLAESMPNPAQRFRAVGELLRALWATPRALSDILKRYSPALAEQLEGHIARVTDAPTDNAGLPTGDARLRWLVQQVRALLPGDKLLVFVESAVAVRALKEALDPFVNGNLAMFHRELAPRDQDRQVAWFRDPEGPSIMLSTEAGGEGRNFQFCHQVVLYDLPWRPATVEQRIGRVDRVGQKRDVRVLVPFFSQGYEAAVLKIMQQSIGVLDRTVGGIDHALEYVSDRLAELMLTGAGADAWKELFLHTESLVGTARKRIEDGVDPILDHASFSPERAEAVLARVPVELESRLESFVQRYAGHSKLEMHAKGKYPLAIEGAPGAAGRLDAESGYVATFSRTYGLDHEDVEFLSFGHPLVEQALEWARTGEEASAALAICRGFAHDGAVFVWSFGLDLPDDGSDAGAYFDAPMLTFALDEAGKRVPEFDDILDQPGKELDRMDPTPLKASLGRWRKLIEQNFIAAETLAEEALQGRRAQALAKLQMAMQKRERDIARSWARARSAFGVGDQEQTLAQEDHAGREAALANDRTRLQSALAHARPRLLAAVAVRLMRSKVVSA